MDTNNLDRNSVVKNDDVFDGTNSLKLPEIVPARQSYYNSKVPTLLSKPKLKRTTSVPSNIPVLPAQNVSFRKSKHTSESEATFRESKRSTFNRVRSENLLDFKKATAQSGLHYTSNPFFRSGRKDSYRTINRQNSRGQPNPRSGRNLWRKASTGLVLPLVLVSLQKKKYGQKCWTVKNKQRSRNNLGLSNISFQRDLLAKFRLAVKVVIFCIRNFTEHCLNKNEEDDELSPFIKQVNFRDMGKDAMADLLFDPTKFKANRQKRISEETKRILSKPSRDRTEQELYSAEIALRGIKGVADYPARMQRKIAEVGQYETYEAKRVIIRQGHPANAFYFILSGAVVVMVMDQDRKYARPVAHLYKGQTFGELAIINSSIRQSSVIAKETCEFLSISAKDYRKIFMAGGVKNINDPDQEAFLKSLSCLDGWPIHVMQNNLSKCQFLYFKRGEVIAKDTHYSDWLVIVKSGSLQVLKKLKKVGAFEQKRQNDLEVLNGKKRREREEKRRQWRRILPEIKIPLQSVEEDVTETELVNGRPRPFDHSQFLTFQIYPPFSRDGKRGSKNSFANINEQLLRITCSHKIHGKSSSKYLVNVTPPGGASIQQVSNKPSSRSEQEIRESTQDRVPEKSIGLEVPVPSLTKRDRSSSVVAEEEQELLGFKPHIRTIMEDIDAGIRRKASDDITAADMNPEFVHVQTLTKGQVYGLADLILKDQPSFCIVSNGADCLLIDKTFYINNASEKLQRQLLQELCPYPTDDELQQGLQVSVDWQAFRTETLQNSLHNVQRRKQMRTTINGTKTQESF